MTDTVEKLSEDLKQFAIARNWEQYHTPKNLSMALIAEAAELIEHFQWLTPEESQAISGEKHKEIGYEMADIFIYLLRMAEQMDIDLMKVTREKMAINETRFPPADKIQPES